MSTIREIASRVGSVPTVEEVLVKRIRLFEADAYRYFTYKNYRFYLLCAAISVRYFAGVILTMLLNSLTR